MSPDYPENEYQEEGGSLKDSIPFFPYSAILAALILVVALFAVFSGESHSAGLTIEVKNQLGVPVRGAEVNVFGEETNLRLFTDKEGKVSFEALNGEELEVVISRENYGDEKKVIEAGEEEIVKVTLKPPLFVSKSITVSFAGPDGKKLAGKEVKARFTCSTGMEFGKEEYSAKEGELTLEPPAGCGIIGITAYCEGFETLSAVILGKDEILEFGAVERPEGSVEITVKDLDSNRLVEGMRVKIMGPMGNTGLEAYTYFGEAKFSGVEIGEYYAVVEDPEDNYGIEKTEFIVEEGKGIEKTVFVSKDLKVRAKGKVLTQAGEPVEGAKLMLYEAGEGEATAHALAAEEYTDSLGEGVFAVTNQGNYSIQAYKEGFFPSEALFFSTQDYGRGSEQEFSIVLEECTPETCASLKVRVIDEDGIPIENARVMLLNENGFLENSYGYKLTDYEGYTGNFIGVKGGTYSVLAQSYPWEGNSGEIYVNPLSSNYAEVVMEIGKGGVSIYAHDNAGEPVAFAEAEFFTDYGESLGEVALDSGGTAYIDGVKADKKVYAVIKGDGYLNYTTAAKSVAKNGTCFFEAVMEKESEAKGLKVEFAGAYSQSGFETGSFSAGEKYGAVFYLTVPSSGNYREAGVFFRAGEKETLDEDRIWVKEANCPAAEFIRGTGFYPPAGAYEITNGAAKWVSAKTGGEPGTYEIVFTVEVDGGTVPETYLPLFYRAWGVEGTKYARDPFDTQLGEAQETTAKGEIYAADYEAPYYEGVEGLCYDDICFAYRLFDMETGEIMEEPYDTDILRKYRLEFSATNNSRADYSGAVLNVRSLESFAGETGAIGIESYTITNADAVEIASQEPSFSAEITDLGNFRQNRTVRGSIVLEPKENEFSGVRLTLASGDYVALDETIYLDSYSEPNIDLDATPAELIAFIPATMEITAAYIYGDDEGKGIEGADITVKKTTDAGTEVLFSGTTDSEGRASAEIPASSPGTVISVAAEKHGLGHASLQRKLRDSIAEFNPEGVSVVINADDSQKTTEFSCILAAQTELVLSKLRLSGTFKGMVDEGEMDGFLRQFEGITLNSLSRTSMRLITIPAEKALELEQPETLSGAITVELTLAENPDYRWLTKLPLKIMVIPSEKNAADTNQSGVCTAIPQSQWEASTKNGEAILETQVKNTCHDTNISAAVEWGAEPAMGHVELVFTDTKTKKEYRRALQEDVWIGFGAADAKTYDARIVFVPKEGTDGDSAEFSVMIGSEGDYVEVKSRIQIINLENCIRTSAGQGAGKILDMGTRDSAELTIDAAQCPDQEIEIRLCNGNPDCAGGTTGGITLGKTQLTLRQNTQAITIKRQNTPGIYGINIQAKTQNTQWTNIGETLVAIQPQNTQTKPNNPFSTIDYSAVLFAASGRYTHSGAPFELGQYNYMLVGKGSEDSVTLTNLHLSETVKVSADVCDWANAGENSGEAIAMLETAGDSAAALALNGVEPYLAAASAAGFEVSMEAGQAFTSASESAEDAVGEGEGITDDTSELSDKVGELEDSQDELEDTAEDGQQEIGGTGIAASATVQSQCDTSTAETAMTELSSIAGILVNVVSGEAEGDVEDIGDVAEDIESTAKSAKSSMENSQNTFEQAWDTAAPTGGDSLGSNCGKSQALIASARSQASSATREYEEVATDLSDDMEEANEDLSDALEDIKDTQSTMETAITTVDSAISSSESEIPYRIAGCEAAKVVARAAVTTIRTIAMNDVSDAISEEESAAEDVVSAAETVAGTAEGAQAAGESYMDALSGSEGTPEYACNRLAEAAKPAETVNGFMWGVYGEIISDYLSFGFINGGLEGGLYGEEGECGKKVSLSLIDWVVNLASEDGSGDALPLSLDVNGITPRWDFTSNKIIGQFDRQEVGIAFMNDGVKEEEKDSVYTTLTVAATEHSHSPATSAGGSLLGLFNVPDSSTSEVSQEYHLRFKTSQKQVITTSSKYDAEACTVQNRAGYTGEKAVPKIKLSWDWDYFKAYPCDEPKEPKVDCLENPENELCVNRDNYIYCDATQFNMEINHKLNVLKKFIERNRSSLRCPENPAKLILDDLTEGLSDLGYYEEEEVDSGCWLPKSTKIIDGRTALDYFIEGNEASITWVPEENLASRQDLRELLNFNVYLMKDGYSKDFLADFEKYSTNTAFFDPPEFFISNEGFAEYYRNGKIEFVRNYAENQNALSAPGLYSARIEVDFGDEWDFFDDGASAGISIKLGFLEEPELDSPFYSMPFNGLVGSEGASYARKGYGIAYSSGGELVQVNNSPVPVMGYSGSEKDSILLAETRINTDLYSLNTSPETRGMLLRIDNPVDGKLNLVFQPSQATPVVMNVSQEKASSTGFSAYYGVFESEVPVRLGANANYWSGAGKCADFTGADIDDVFYEEPDRASTERDIVLDWRDIYAIDWKNAARGGSVYLKTIFYTAPKSDAKLKSYSGGVLEFTTSDEAGSIVGLNGISEMPYNNLAGGTAGTVDSIEDVLELVRAGDVCVTSTDSKTEFWWNTASIYSKSGKERSINEFERTLSGSACK